MEVSKVTIRTVPELKEPVLGVPADVLKAVSQRSLDEIREQFPGIWEDAVTCQTSEVEKNR